MWLDKENLRLNEGRSAQQRKKKSLEVSGLAEVL